MTLQEAVEILSMMTPVRSYDGTGQLWFGDNQNMSDATFEDWGAARATAVILNAVHEHTLSDHSGCHDEINLLRQAARQVVDERGPHSTPSNGAIERLRNLLPEDDDLRVLRRHGQGR